MEYKQLKFEVKALNEAGEFEGYAAVKKNVDAYGDIIEDGAFKRTIRNQKKFPILFMHDPAKPVGISMHMKEDNHGLFTRGKIDTSTELGRMVYSGLKNGYISEMSIGYKVVQDDMNKKGNRLLKEIKLLEYSLITRGFAANELALVSNFKSSPQLDALTKRVSYLEGQLIEKEDELMEDEKEAKTHEHLSLIMTRLEAMEALIDELKSKCNGLEKSLADSPEALSHREDSSEDTLSIKAVSGSSDLPLAPKDHEWDGPAAKKRIFEWAGGDDFDPAKAKRAFFYFDPANPNLKSSYKLPFADLIDGKLMAIPKALSAVKGALDGARGTGVDIPDADKAKIRSKVDNYQKRMAEDGKVSSLVLDLKDYLRSVE